MTESKLQALIDELCPDGVEYKAVSELYKRIKGTPITAGQMKEIAKEDGDIRIFAGGKTVVNAFEEDIPNANITRTPAVLVQSRGVIDFIYYDRPFTFKNEMWAYVLKDETMSLKYLYYALSNDVAYFRDAAKGMGSLPQISLPVTENYEIPVPPLPVQEEIVRILDSFTELTAELTVELTAELTARKKQYEYYREEVLKFDGRIDVEWAPLSEVTKVITKGTTPKQFQSSGINFVKTEAFENNRINPYKLSHIDLETHCGFLKRSILEVNDILLTIAGATIGKCALVTDDILPANTNQALAIIRLNDDMNYRYVMHIIQSNIMRNYIDISVKGSAQPNLSLQQIRDFVIPIPKDINEQERIVEILDRFDALCNDITAGLPAEIEARQKQYEYYRDKLLSFKRK